jgi:hypothetical protein
MAGRNGIMDIRQFAIEQVEVGAAYAARRNSQKYLIFPWRRKGQIFGHQRLLAAMEAHGTHNGRRA